MLLRREFPEGNVGLPDISPQSEAKPLELADPFLQRLLSAASVEDKFIKDRLDEMGDDATEVFQGSSTFANGLF